MTNDMTKGSPIKLILSFMVPLLIGNIFQQFYNMADTIIVGRTISVEAPYPVIPVQFPGKGNPVC